MDEEIDPAVLQYAQWLADMKQKASAAQHSQQSDIVGLSEGLTTTTSALKEFKRSQTSLTQQLLQQVTELREKLSDCFAEIAALARQKAEVDLRAQQELGHFREVLDTKDRELEQLRRQQAEQMSTIQAQLTHATSKLSQQEHLIDDLRRSVHTGQEATVAKLGDVDRAIELFHKSLEQSRQDLLDFTRDATEERSWVREKFGLLEDQYGDYMKQATVVANKTQAQVYVLEEATRVNTEKRQQCEGQLNGVSRELVEHQNQLALLRLHDGSRTLSRTDSYSESGTESSASTVRRTASSATASSMGGARVPAPAGGPWAAAASPQQWASSPAGRMGGMGGGYDPHTAVDPFAHR